MTNFKKVMLVYIMLYIRPIKIVYFHGLHFIILFTFQPDRCLVLGIGDKYKVLDLVAESREQRDKWVTALKYFQRRIKKKMELDPEAAKQEYLLLLISCLISYIFFFHFFYVVRLFPSEYNVYP